jgi:hypothetical protein
LPAAKLLIAREQKLLQQSGETSTHQAVNQVLIQAIEVLSVKNARGALILRERFEQRKTTNELSKEINLAADTINRLQREAIEQLAQIIGERERVLRDERVIELTGRLDAATYSKLFGVDSLLTQVMASISAETDPWLYLLCGIGGIGKTALADAALRAIIPTFRFDDVAAVRVTPKPLSGRAADPHGVYEQVVTRLYETFIGHPSGGTLASKAQQLHAHLKAKPHLILIDNLEDEAQAVYLLDQITAWTNPSKVILTSRARAALQRPVKTLTLGELTEANALAYLRHEGHTRQIPGIGTALDAELLPIYSVVGGNALALKLTITLTEQWPLSAILDDLQNVRTRSVDEMYRRIFLLAWSTLSEQGRILLESMPLAGDDGADIDDLRATTGLGDAELLMALQELVARSLIEVRGTPWERLYGIHRLTDTFVRADIIGWTDTQ